jgi:hypothetical protein
MIKEPADSWQRQEIFLFSIAFKPPLASIQPPILWVPGYLGVKQLGREADTHLNLMPWLRIVELYLDYFMSSGHSA